MLVSAKEMLEKARDGKYADKLLSTREDKLERNFISKVYVFLNKEVDLWVSIDR